MSRTTTCRCDTAHVEPVVLPQGHLLGAGKAWRAAKPGGIYLAGHGFHFTNEDDANDYAFGEDDQGELDPETGT